MPCRARGVLRVLRTPVWFLFVPVDATGSLRHRVLTVSRLRALYLVRVKPPTVQAEQGLSYRTPLFSKIAKGEHHSAGGQCGVCLPRCVSGHSFDAGSGRGAARCVMATRHRDSLLQPLEGLDKTRNELIPPISLAGSWNVHVIAGLAYLLSTRV